MDESELRIRVNGDETIPILIEYVVNELLKIKKIPYQFSVEELPIYDRYVQPGKVLMVDYDLILKRVDIDE